MAAPQNPYRPDPVSQLELGILRVQQPDRNHQNGGKSFYFFDLDDNVMFLDSSIYIFHRETGDELALSTGEFAAQSRDVGRAGPYRGYEVRAEDDQTGSFRRFRDYGPDATRGGQPFLEDLLASLARPDFHWKGPSWNCFYHACFNQRPISLITARGHHPETVRDGIELLVDRGHLPQTPNYLSVFPVSHPDVRMSLGDSSLSQSVSQLKRRAIISSVKNAMRLYGENPHHRFGMSDDSPENLELIHEAMIELKKQFPRNSFYIFDTHQGRLVKREIGLDRVIEADSLEQASQMELF